MEQYLTGEHMYAVHRLEVKRLLGDVLPFWEELDSQDQNEWQKDADELNMARLGPPKGLDEAWQ